jgi:hypothetical protein
MARLKIAHDIKNRCMVLRMLQAMPEAMADMPDAIKAIVDLKAYETRAMRIAVKLLGME